MVSITPDSPVASVFGRSPKRKLVEEGLGITTVGELLRHFPRRYVETTELSEVGTPEVGKAPVCGGPEVGKGAGGNGAPEVGGAKPPPGGGKAEPADRSTTRTRRSLGALGSRTSAPGSRRTA